MEYPRTDWELIVLNKGLDIESQLDNASESLQSEAEISGDQDLKSVELKIGQTLPGTGFKIQDLRDQPEFLDPANSGIALDDRTKPQIRKAFEELHLMLPPVNLTSRDVTRWKMAWRAIQWNNQWNKWKDPDRTTFTQIMRGQFLTHRCENWANLDKILGLPAIALGFTAATLIYGGLHALAWQAHFDSSTERLLWRVSSCLIMAGLPVILGLIKVVMKFLDYQSSQGRGSDVMMITAIIMVVLLIPAYVLARAFLVLECFINLFNLPAGVFATPSWSIYFPHIS